MGVCPYEVRVTDLRSASADERSCSDVTMSDGTGAVGGSGGSGTGAVVIDIPTNCTTPDTSDIELTEQMVDARLPVHRVLYSWTTAEQEAGLRDGARLFSVGVVDGKGRGIALDALFAFAEQNPDSLEAQLTVLFDKARYAWPNPWATRMGFGTESYGDRLLKIVLSEEAWIARLSPAGTVADVWDLEGAPVAPEDVAATPERIAAFFFVRTSEAGPQCGSFFGGTGGYREFVLGNLEIGSQAILDRIDSDISALTEYLEVVRPCPPALGNNFNAAVFCNWGYTGDPYLESLSLPDDPYVPTAANLTTIIETLTADRFTPDPFTVTLE